MGDDKDTINKLITEISGVYRKKGEPEWQTKLVYDSYAETLEPVYFWLLDFMETLGLKVEKISDNFTASPGSGYFGDMSQRMSNVQDRAMTLLKLVNDMIRNIISVINDLKSRELKLKDYDDRTSEEKGIKESAILSLKRRWADEVDMKKGRGALLSMTQQAFPGIMDAFMQCNSIEDADKLEVNEMIKRTLKPRIKEWQDWIKKSEEAERKYYRIEKGHLRTQINNLRLYARWAKPYLKTSEQLRMKDMKTPSLVSAFNTMILELSLLGKSEINPKQEAIAENLPLKFKKLKMDRKFYQCVFIDFVFRGIPRAIPAAQRGHYVHGGRAEIKFKSYALNEDEILLLNKKLEDEDMKYILDISEGVSETGLAELKEDIDRFLNKSEKGEKEEKSSDINPFSELGKAFIGMFGLGEKKKGDVKGKTDEELLKEKAALLEKEGIKKDSYEEGLIRKVAEKKAGKTGFIVFDVYKKAHGMESFPSF